MDQKIKTYTYFINKHLYDSCAVFGSGTSLYNINFSALQDKVPVICTNASFLLFNWHTPTAKNRYWISNDSTCIKWNWWHRLKRTQSNKIVRDSWQKHEKEIRNFYIFNKRQTPEYIIDPKEIGLAYCSSIPSALDLAIQMGCKQIYMFGVDHYFDNNRAYFWEYWPETRRPFILGRKQWKADQPAQSRVFNYNYAAYVALDLFANSMGAKIYNCSPNSKIDIFKKIGIENGIKRLTK